MLEEDKLYKAKDKWHKDRMKRIQFLNKRLHQKIEARAYINNVDEAGWLLSSIFKIEKNIYFLNLGDQIFTVYQKVRKMLTYYLLQWFRAGKNMLFISTLNKWQKKTEMKAAINLPLEWQQGN